LEEVEWPAEVAVGYLCDFYRAEVEHHDGDFLGVDISGSHAIRELMRPLVHQAVTSRLVEGSIPSRLTIQSGAATPPDSSIRASGCGPSRRPAARRDVVRQEPSGRASVTS
jgi:hypothetical protein